MNNPRATVSVVLVLSILAVLPQIGCALSPLAPAATPPPNTLVYDAPVSLTVRSGTQLPGTSIGYSGKSETGAAKVTIAGQVAPKQVGDSLDWQGTPVPNVSVKLTTRVIAFDDKALVVGGTAHIEIANVTIQSGGSPGTAQMEFTAPVTYSLAKNRSIPGSNIFYVGMASEGAQFSGIEGYPYRKRLDSLQYVGRPSPKVFLRLDLRVVNFSETDVVLGGTANIKIESP